MGGVIDITSDDDITRDKRFLPKPLTLELLCRLFSDNDSIAIVITIEDEKARVGM
jgi:hypothetical protein